MIISESSCARTSAIYPPSQIHSREMRRSACKWLCLKASFQSNVVIPYSRICPTTLFAFSDAQPQDAEVCLQVAAPRSKLPIKRCNSPQPNAPCDSFCLLYLAFLVLVYHNSKETFSHSGCRLYSRLPSGFVRDWPELTPKDFWQGILLSAATSLLNRIFPVGILLMDW